MESKEINFHKCCISSYIILLSISGFFLGCVTSYLLIRSFGMKHFYDPIQPSIYFLYGPSLFTFIVCGVGWKGVKKKNSVLLRCFSALLVLLIIIEVSGSIWNCISMQLVHETAAPLFEKKFMEDIKNQEIDAWDTIQKKLKCCGIHGAFDYKTLNIVPFSCCNQTSPIHVPAFCASLHHKGCLDAFTESIEENFAILSVTSAIIALIEIPGVFATWCLANRLRRLKNLSRTVKTMQKSLKKSDMQQIEGLLRQETAA